MYIYDGELELEGMVCKPYAYGEWVAYKDQQQTVIKIDPNIVLALAKYVNEHEDEFFVGE